ncbi:MAG: DUF3330 domain-containing protein [Nitrosomonas sp.]|nr:DUF3330 domain-containing protein [Nitrosomonas sp.]
MSEQRKPLDPEQVACEVCLKEIPISEAKSEEASDYVIHYCSLDCYAKWKEQNTENDQ